MEWAERMTEKADAFKSEEGEKLNNTNRDLETGIAVLESGQKAINDKIEDEGFRLLQNKDTIGNTFAISLCLVNFSYYIVLASIDECFSTLLKGFSYSVL